MLLLVLYLLYNVVSTVSNNSNLKEKQLEIQANQKRNFEMYLKLLKSKYPNQTGLFWANIISSYQHTILKSKDPAIILIVSDKSTK
jgi:hypothetical protein